MGYRESHKESGHYYDSRISGGGFDGYMTAREAAQVPILVAEHFPDAKPRYLDFACGTGRITALIAPLAASTTGVDVSETMLNVAKKRCPQANFVNADLTRTWIELGSFDLVTAFRFFGNAEDALRLAALRQINRLLSSGGLFMLNNHRNPMALASRLNSLSGGGGNMDLTYAKLKKQLEMCGFDIVKSRPMAVWQFRHKIMGSADPASRTGRFLDHMFQSGIFSPIAPNTIILARKCLSLPD